MSPGDTVEVYQKPLTGEDYEGKAKIVRVLSQKPELFGGERFFRCMVNFPEDGPEQAVERLVSEDDVVPATKGGRV